MKNIDEPEEKSIQWLQESAASIEMTCEEDLSTEIENKKGNVTIGNELETLVKGEEYVQEPGQRQIKLMIGAKIIQKIMISIILSQVVVSRDVKFEEQLRVWSINTNQKNDLFRMLDEEEDEEDDDEEEEEDEIPDSKQDTH